MSRLKSKITSKQSIKSSPENITITSNKQLKRSNSKNELQLRKEAVKKSISLLDLFHANIIKTNLTDRFYSLNRHLHKLKNDNKKNDNKLNYTLSYATCNIYASIRRLISALEWIDIDTINIIQKIKELLFVLVYFDEKTSSLVLDIEVIDKLIEYLIDFEDFLTIFFTKYYTEEIKKIGVVKDTTGRLILKLEDKDTNCCFSE